MSKIKSCLLMVFIFVFALFLVGCGPKAPTEITIKYDIFDGPEDAPYVLVGNSMYLSSEVNEGADPTVTWSLAETDKASLVEEDGCAVVTGLAGGVVELTCASAIDPAVSATVVIEVVKSENYHLVLVDAAAEIKAALPQYVDKDFTLPTLDNPNIKLTYLSKLKDVWADGVFRYTYEGEDAEYQFYVRMAYRGIEVEQSLSVKVVKDAEKNSFVTLAKAEKIVDDFMAKYVSNEEGRAVNENSEGMVVEAEWNSTGLPGLLLPGSTTAEETGLPVKIWWQVEELKQNDILPLKLNQYTPADGGETRYFITYEQLEMPLECVFSAFLQVDNEDGTSKVIKKVYKITGDGYGMEGIVEYFLSKGYILEAQVVLEKAKTVMNVDTSGKFKNLVVKYSIDDPTIAKVASLNSTSTIINPTKNGTATITATFCYNIREVQVLEIKLDADGNPVLDENGEVVKEVVTKQQAQYEYEYKMEITINNKAN